MSVKPLKYYSKFTLYASVLSAFLPFSHYRVTPILGAWVLNEYSKVLIARIEAGEHISNYMIASGMTTIAGFVALTRNIAFLASFNTRPTTLLPSFISALSFATASWYLFATISESLKAKVIEKKEYIRLKKNVEQYKKKQWEEVKEVYKQIDWETGKRQPFE
jgi:flagellar biosynthesis component FlhA